MVIKLLPESSFRFFYSENADTLPHFHRCIEILYITEGSIACEINGEKLPFEVNENATFSRGRYVSKNIEYFISVDREPFLREIQALKIKSEEYLKDVDLNRKNIETCNTILETWDPAAAEKKKNDDRLTSMENRIGGMENMIKAMYEQFKKSEK